ncbi:c-type cytochrome biogenesis protein CcsB [Cellulomonas marina]|uniref:Cytochrome c-type biogenesis protein CcsB n=1 Tax=Cellulomonas marina TaxID=988821 RepID=A0A1I0XKX9_9CELL|nr:c-type cytochrome biogenesis protein CcsB [Cellulomonas marina]GIG30080.1 c-type cytochrome biogenesis protein CcsB [Cellulomonas marina]SFB00868.1 cytochrome c-type biogenesis protein CcsB [Cellulomonas marina]
MSTGDLSTLLVWGATTVFTIALVAWTVDLARIADAATRAARTARPSAQARAHVAVGTGLGTITLEGDAGSGGGLGRAEDDGPAMGRSVRAEGIARSTTWLGLAFLLGGIVLRGVASGRWPTANMYEFTLVGTFVAVLVLAVVQFRRTVAFLGVLVMGIAVLALALGLLVFFVQADAVQPALQSYWLVIHVGVAIAATGVFTVGFGAAVLQLLVDGREQGRSHVAAPGATSGARRALHDWRVTGPRFAWLRQVPSATRLEALSFRLNAVGFVLWTFTLIGGAIWAEHAWGRYWGWDPKEVGTFVAWVVYAAYLHARTTRGWTGRRAAFFVLVGYAVVLANFTVVNLFVTGKHSYSGL